MPLFFVYAWVLCFWFVFLPFVLLVPCFFFVFLLLLFFLLRLLIIILVLVFLQTWKERSTWSKKGRKEKERKERNPMRRRKRKKGRKEKKWTMDSHAPFLGLSVNAWLLCFFCFVFLPFVLLGPCFFFFLLFVFLLLFFLFLSLSKNGRKDLAGLRKEESKNKGRKGILWEEGRERKEERKKMEGKIYLV